MWTVTRIQDDNENIAFNENDKVQIKNVDMDKETVDDNADKEPEHENENPDELNEDVTLDPETLEPLNNKNIIFHNPVLCSD